MLLTMMDACMLDVFPWSKRSLLLVKSHLRQIIVVSAEQLVKFPRIRQQRQVGGRLGRYPVTLEIVYSTSDNGRW